MADDAVGPCRDHALSRLDLDDAGGITVLPLWLGDKTQGIASFRIISLANTQLYETRRKTFASRDAERVALQRRAADIGHS
jgi:hypothetical protein